MTKDEINERIKKLAYKLKMVPKGEQPNKELEDEALQLSLIEPKFVEIIVEEIMNKQPENNECRICGQELVAEQGFYARYFCPTCG